MLSNANFARDGVFPAPLAEVVQAARQNPALRVFNPRYGGHVGYALATDWYRALLRSSLD